MEKELVLSRILKVLITGGYGFLGGNLAKYLSDEGYEVFLGTRYLDEKSRTLLTFKAEAREVLWESSKSLLSASQSLDAIIHLAGMNAQQCLKNPNKAYDFRSRSSTFLKEVFIKNKIKKLLYISSAHVYSDKCIGSFSENSPILNKHPYAKSLMIGENVLLDLKKNYKSNVHILRPSNGYGVPVFQNTDCWHLFVNNICKQAVEQKKITIRSFHEQRNFIPISETCKAINFFLKNDISSESPINIGSNESFSLKEKATAVSKRCKDLFNYEPAINLEEVKDHEVREVTIKTKYIYQNNLLTNFGFKFSYDHINEIDNLLLFLSENSES